MLKLGKDKSQAKELNLPFDVILEGGSGHFVATCPFFPGARAEGSTRAEALKHLQDLIRLRLRLAVVPEFDIVWRGPLHPTWNALGVFADRLVAGSNKDGALSSVSGDFGSWDLGWVVQNQAAERLDVIPGDGNAPSAKEGSSLPDYATQIYCFSQFDGGKALKLYAGTSADGAIYESLDGLSWDLAYRTGQDRVHCMVSFKDRLYAGTSAPGKLFCYTGRHWSLAHRSVESALTALIEFQGQCYMGTYPGGHIYASGDGVKWRLVHDSEQTFVRAFAVFDGLLYAATSKNSGGQILRSRDGEIWEKVFESRDPNYYCLKVFQHSLWLGTGNNGRVYRSQDGAHWTLGAALEDEGIRAMESFEGRLYLASEGLGTIYRSRFSDGPVSAILEPRASTVASQEAVIEWRTELPSDSRVHYWSEDGVDRECSSKALVTEHRLELSGLDPLTSYQFRVSSRSSGIAGDCLSPVLDFRTAPAEIPQIRSFTHPHPERWYNTRGVQFSWTVPAGAVRFHFLLDRVPDTLPNAGSAEARSTTDTGAQFEGLEDGEWWFHVRCEDSAGHLGSQAAHFHVGVDGSALPPRLMSSSHPVPGAWSKNGILEAFWEAPEDLSGIQGYWVLADQRSGTVPGPQNGHWIDVPAYRMDLPVDGDWFLHVVSVDRAGNLSRDASHYHLRLDRRADPPVAVLVEQPGSGKWLTSERVEFEWTPPQDLSGVSGYYYLFDQDADSVPTADGAIFTTSTHASCRARQDGLWYFHVVTQDLAGNVGTQACHLELRIDTSALPPLIDSPSHPRGRWSSATQAVFELSDGPDFSGITAHFYVLDRAASTQVIVANAAMTTQNRIEIKGLSDGQWWLHVISQDAAGNVGTEASHYPIWIDTQAFPPQIAPECLAIQDRWLSQATVEMAWDPAEDVAGTEGYFFLVDAEPGTLPTQDNGQSTRENKVTLDMPEGVHNFHISAKDGAGNVSSSASHCRIRVDRTASPAIVESPSHPEGQWSSERSLDFCWKEPADLSGIDGYIWSFDREPLNIPTAANGQFTEANKLRIDTFEGPEGVWYFHLVSRDRAGNIGPEAAHFQVRLDFSVGVPSVKSLTHPDPNSWYGSSKVEFELSGPADLSGIAGYYFSMDHTEGTSPSPRNATWSESPRVSFSGLSDGVWYFHAVAKDQAGNVGELAALQIIRVDTHAAPPLALTSKTHPSDRWVRDPSPVISWAAPEDASGVDGYYWILDDKPLTIPSRGQGQFTRDEQMTAMGLKDGRWFFHIVTLDGAGNVGKQAAHLALRIDSVATPPEVLCLTHPDPDLEYAGSAPAFGWKVPADPSGIEGYHYCVDQIAGTIPGNRDPWTTDTRLAPGLFPDGTWYLHVAAKDGAGNLGPQAAHVKFRVNSSLGGLAGRVTRANGVTAAVGTRLELKKSDRLVAVAEADQNGDFGFQSLVPGIYHLAIHEQGLPPLELDSLHVGPGERRLALSTEVCAFRDDSDPGKMLFYVLGREPGTLSLKIYRESGTVVSTLEREVGQAGYSRLSWAPESGDAGTFLFQAALKGASGKQWKYPIRKVQTA